jgi:hypothetical protein
MAKRTDDEKLNRPKHYEYMGLALLGEDHQEYGRLKKMLDDKYDPEIKTRLNAAERKELEDLALAGLAEYNIRQEEAYQRHFTEENKGS